MKMSQALINGERERERDFIIATMEKVWSKFVHDIWLVLSPKLNQATHEVFMQVEISLII